MGVFMSSRRHLIGLKSFEINLNRPVFIYFLALFGFKRANLASDLRPFNTIEQNGMIRAVARGAQADIALHLPWRMHVNALSQHLGLQDFNGFISRRKPAQQRSRTS